MLIQSFIQPDEQKAIYDFILGLRNIPISATGELVWFWKLSQVGKIIPELISIRKRVISVIGECYLEPDLEDMLVYVLPNGHIKEHNDSAPHGYEHIRANILIQNPEQGGELIHDGKLIEWTERDLYVLEAQKPHKVNKLTGEKSLLVVSYGFLKKIQ